MVRERVKVEEEEGVVRRERRVRQRVQIMVVVVCCVGRECVGCDRPMDFGNWELVWRFEVQTVPKRKVCGGEVRGRDVARDQAHDTKCHERLLSSSTNQSMYSNSHVHTYRIIFGSSWKKKKDTVTQNQR